MLSQTPNRALFRDPALAHSADEALPTLRPLEEAPSDVLNFSAVSKPSLIRDLCRASVPGWSAIPENQVVIDQLGEGLSNQNFKVHLDIPGGDGQTHTPCVLFRAYGKDVSAIYDSAIELEIVKTLAKYGIVQRLFADGEDWRIEGWHFAVALPHRSMKNPAIFLQMASHLGRLHKLSSRLDFPSHIKSLEPWTWSRFGLWAEGAVRAAKCIGLSSQNAALAEVSVEEMVAETHWLREFMTEDDPHILGSGLDVVFSHWDCQENNVLQTMHGLRFIDFEYSGMEHQAFDIATYFVECAIDYLHPSHPYFKITLSDFPSEDEMRLFCSVYLSEYLETTVRTRDIAVQVLIDRVRRFTLVNHLLWAMWSVIRAGQSPTFGKFDYLHYAHCRWFMYKWSKRAVLDAVASKQL